MDFPMTNDESRVTRLRQGSGAASPPSHDYGLGYLFSAKGAAFSTSPPHRTDSPWRTWGSAPGCHVTQKCSSAESAIHFCRDFVSIIRHRIDFDRQYIREASRD